MNGMPFITVKHNIEVAHRLYEMAGKCENIHGHSMWVEMYLFGQLNGHGVLEGLEFGKVKQRFRAFLDMEFDHHLLLNEKDPWAQPITVVDAPHMSQQRLPGLQIMPGDPTTENLSKWIAEWAADEWKLPVQIKVQETPVNGASHSIDPEPFKVTNTTGEYVMTLPQGGTKH